MSAIDALSGVSEVLCKLSRSKKQFWEGKVDRLLDLAASLPAFTKACDCELARSKFIDAKRAGPVSDMNDRAFRFVTAFTELARAHNALANSKKAEAIEQKISAYVALKLEEVKGLAAASID
eukprot:6558223-Alexandrium_andersonii.AAC.1